MFPKGFADMPNSFYDVHKVYLATKADLDNEKLEEQKREMDRVRSGG